MTDLPELLSNSIPQRRVGGNRDFILKYSSLAIRSNPDFFCSKERRKTFSFSCFNPETCEGEPDSSPRVYLYRRCLWFHVWFPVGHIQKTLKDLIGNSALRINSMCSSFSGVSSLMSEQSLPATSENIQRAINVIDRQRGGVERNFYLP